MGIIFTVLMQKGELMSNLINRQDAIDVIMGEPTDAHYPSWYASKIKALPSTDRLTEWIPCSERLPKKNGEYIASLEDSVYPWASFFNGKWFMLSLNGIAREFGEYEVIAWMPMPEPYKAESEDKE